MKSNLTIITIIIISQIIYIGENRKSSCKILDKKNNNYNKFIKKDKNHYNQINLTLSYVTSTNKIGIDSFRCRSKVIRFIFQDYNY